MHGPHGIKAWSSAQPVIALSSGEAEYYGMVKGTGNALGTSGVLQDLGIKLPIALYTDSSAAKGIASRRGLGKVRHIELNELWLQDQVARGRVRVFKVLGERNLADSLTKTSTAEKIGLTMRGTSSEARAGRHELAPALAE